MPSFIIKVPNDDEGEELGEFQADYLPRAGDPFFINHPRLCRKRDDVFCGVVESVMHEAHADGPDGPHVVTTVWVVQEQAAPTLYCDCTEEERVKWPVVGLDGRCENCGHMRRDRGRGS